MQIVTQLEHSLSKERERLQAMMAHLHLTKESNTKSEANNAVPGGNQLRKPTLSLMDRNERSQSEGPPSHPPISPPISNIDSNTRPKTPPLKMRPPPVPPPMSGKRKLIGRVQKSYNHKLLFESIYVFLSLFESISVYWVHLCLLKSI